MKWRSRLDVKIVSPCNEYFRAKYIDTPIKCIFYHFKSVQSSLFRVIVEVYEVFFLMHYGERTPERVRIESTMCDFRWYSSWLGCKAGFQEEVCQLSFESH